MTAASAESIERVGLRHRLRPNLPVLALVAWTLFVWVGRVRNIVTDDALSGWSMIWRLGLALTFVVAAVATIGALLTRPGAIVATSRFLALFGIVVWLIRGTDIALGDHSLAFIAIHSVLAVVTITLGVWVLRRAGNRPRPVSSTGDG